MDTNAMAILIAAMSGQPDSNQSLFLIFGMIITAIGSITATVASLFANAQAKSTAKNAALTSETAEKIHIAVNSERTAMMLKVDALTGQVLKLSEEISTLKERERGSDLKAAVESGPLTEKRLVEILNARDKDKP